MTDYVQISAQITDATRRRLDQYARETGIKKSRIIESAIEQHLSALEELPAHYVVPAQIVLTPESFDEVLERISHPGEPAAALVDLMRDSRLRCDAD